MSKFTKGLNPEQRVAVETTEGPLLVLAGAGTGKTKVITHRIAYMLAQGVPARSILAMTFTNKAAGEMKARIGKLVSAARAADLTVGTFHSFCVKALRRHGEVVGVRRGFGICDADDQLVAMKRAQRELQIPETQLNPRISLSRVSLLKSRLTGPEGIMKSSDPSEADLGHAYQRYDKALRASGLLDFDDLLLYMVRLLQDKKMLAMFQKRFQYILVDEYQDTNGPQYELVRLIGGKLRNVCVVGDDDQSIYGWRGADVSKILNFEKDFPKAVVVRLETNYRSTPQILEGANAVIRNNPSRHEKALRPASRDGETIVAQKLPDEEDEATYVVDDLVRRARAERLPWADFAILFRTAMQPRVFEVELRSRQIPYNLVGGMSFFDRKEVRDMLAYLKLVANPADELSLLRVINTPARGVGTGSIEKMMGIAAQHGVPLADVILHSERYSGVPRSADAAKKFLETLDNLRHLQSGPDLVTLVKNLIEDVDYAAEIRKHYTDRTACQKRIDAVHEIMNMAESHGRAGGSDLTSFLEDVALSANDDDADETEGDRVTLMTLHSAKGLEYSQVYLVGAEEGLLPHSRSIQDGAVEEERRLAYVGITRAKHRLTVTYVKSRARYGRRIAVLPSRFLYEMRGKQPPPKLLELAEKQVSSAAEKKPVKKRKSRKRTKRS